ncbi:MAG: M20/M25/M40 family metallo-hydrolase [Chloroflexi bacterium]|nr:M20/M25/M40 family metallo-hydrolase [Chloroflexota bacterium]
MSYDPIEFAKKYQLSLEAAREDYPNRGTCGLEVELFLLDSDLRPLSTVGAGPSKESFVDYLRKNNVPKSVRKQTDLEAFQWMVEWGTNPYYSPRGAVYEGRILQGVILNALDEAGQTHAEKLHLWQGNLPYSTTVNYDSIPGGWHLAKRRYIEKCVDMYGDTLSTAGNHTNISLPETLLMWDFMHLPAAEREGLLLDNYKNDVYISATRLLRAFAPLFIATSAASPFQAAIRDGEAVVLMTEHNSLRSQIFPKPAALDVPDIYRSHTDYIQTSYDLVRRGARFGNNNWIPVRARSLEERVESLIEVTSDELEKLYSRGLYAAGEAQPLDEMAHQIEVQNMLARVDLPMTRVEIRTDDGGNPLDLELANMTLKNLLTTRIYADPEFARAFRYDSEDIRLARQNERTVAQKGLEAEIANPFTGKPVQMRDFLRWTLAEIRPLAEALGQWEDLRPLTEMVAGAPNTAQRLRNDVRAQIGESDVVPQDLFMEIVSQHEKQIADEIEIIASSAALWQSENQKLGDVLYKLRSHAHKNAQAPIRFSPQQESLINIEYPDTTTEIVDLASRLIRIPSITASPDEKLDEVHRAAVFIYDYCQSHGLKVRFFDQEKYPSMMISFPGQEEAPVMLSGHFDVVEPEPDNEQFKPKIVGDYLWGRGAGDMKTVVATYMVWMKDTLKKGAPYPPINLMLIGNEENGEGEPMGTPHVLALLKEETGYEPKIFIAGERTEEKGNALWGEICTENRGAMRFDIIAKGKRGHSGVAKANMDISEQLIEMRTKLQKLAEEYFTLESADGWKSQIRFPFIQIGTPGVYNITADYGILGVEIRSIPQDNLDGYIAQAQVYCEESKLEIKLGGIEGGIACDPENLYLKKLIAAVELASGEKAPLGRKLPGTSARFAPNGQGVVWGQSGIGPHTSEERHYIPSILPYYEALNAYGNLLIEKE